MPSWAIKAGVMPLMPRSIAATVKRRSPWAATTYGRSVDTSEANSAPAIPGAAKTLASRSAWLGAAAAPLKIPTRIAPRSRR